MTAAHRFGTLLAVAALCLISPAAGEEGASPAADSAGESGVGTESAPVKSDPAAGVEGFSLGLDRLAFGGAESFGLFTSLAPADGQRPSLLPPGDGRYTVESPRANSLDGLSASLAWQGDGVPDGLSFNFSARTWDDLDGWEKTGLVMSRASAAAGLGYLLYQLFD